MECQELLLLTANFLSPRNISLQFPEIPLLLLHAEKSSILSHLPIIPFGSLLHTWKLTRRQVFSLNENENQKLLPPIQFLTYFLFTGKCLQNNLIPYNIIIEYQQNDPETPSNWEYYTINTYCRFRPSFSSAFPLPLLPFSNMAERRGSLFIK